ncbi:MAG TPA: alpha/beta fold hydrolase [Casimicrobiaceae bacterium]|nr:alpha/beta fold hydrolase [Casimicrobiaceae bacterium]
MSASRGDSQFPTISPPGVGATGDAGGSRRSFLFAAAAASAGLAVRAGDAHAETGTLAEVSGTEHWTVKRAGSDNVELFLWRKQLKNRVASDKSGTILFVHGSSVSATPVFDLQIPGKPEASTMDWFARRGYDTWCVDCEGYGRSDKSRPVNADISCGADDLAAASEYILSKSTDRKLLLYGASSGALRAGLFAQRHAERVQRLALDALVWTGEGSPTLAERKKRLEEYRASNRRPIDRAFVRSIFTRDHPDTSDLTVVEAFADAVLALDKSVPTGTYIDMSANLPVIDPEKISVPVLIMRGQWDGIASFQDLANFFARLPNPDKQFVVMPGIAHTSTRSKNWGLVYHLLDSYFSQPAPVYTG